METGAGTGGTPKGLGREASGDTQGGQWRKSRPRASGFSPWPPMRGRRWRVHAVSAPRREGIPLRWGLCLLHPVPSPGPRSGPKPSLGHVDGSKRFTDVTYSEPGNRGGSSCRRAAKHPVTFLCSECNLFLEALLENLNLVSHQLFIIREAYV